MNHQIWMSELSWSVESYHSSSYLVTLRKPLNPQLQHLIAAQNWKHQKHESEQLVQIWIQNYETSNPSMVLMQN